MQDPGHEEVSAKTLSGRRLVLCECNRCKADDPKGEGDWIPASLRTTHVKAMAINASEISRRGRGWLALRCTIAHSPITLRGLRGRGRLGPQRATAPSPITLRGQRGRGQTRGIPSGAYHLLPLRQ